MTTSARPLRQERTAPTAAVTGSIPRGGQRSRDRIEGLDGLRALAIVGVLVYHLDAAWLPGGFLGVDVFFVVSGFLISTLLVREHRRTGRIALSQFWVRRARRSAAGPRPVRRHERAHRARRQRRPARRRRPADGRRADLLDQLARDHGRVELLRPDRTAALHELLVAGGRGAVLPPLAAHHDRPARPLEPGPGRRLPSPSAAVSALLMALLYVPDADATRVYYGTDTHLIGLMAGAALAFAWASPRLARFVTPSRWGRFGWVAGPACRDRALAEMVLLDEQQPLTFRGGIALASVATTVLIMGVIDSAPAAAGGPRHSSASPGTPQPRGSGRAPTRSTSGTGRSSCSSRSTTPRRRARCRT